jgi:hypothetical protein
LADAAYKSLWTEHLNAKTKSYCLMLMLKAQQPLVVSVFIMSINLESFLTIVSTGYSYISILNEMDG